MEMVFRKTLNTRMPHYTNCAQSFTLASCARDFFTIEKTIQELQMDNTNTKVTTGSGTSFAVEKITPDLELRPLFLMENEFTPVDIFCLVKVDEEGNRSSAWWTEETTHHAQSEGSMTLSKDNKLYVDVHIFDAGGDYGHLTYEVEQDTLRRVPLAG